MPAAEYRLRPLTDLSAGARVRIAEVRGGRAFTHKLLGLGLRVGSEVCVLQQRGRGMVLSSAETRVAVGGGVADQLWVAEVVAAKDVVAGDSVAPRPAA
jgi:ferrous iron transport protein A